MIFGKEKRKTSEDKKKELAKTREIQRKKMIRTKYGQRQRKHAKKGIESCILAAAAVMLLALMISYSFTEKGDISILMGFLGILLVVLAWQGCSYGVYGFRERDKNYITCKVGVACNGIILAFMCGIFIRGLF